MKNTAALMLGITMATALTLQAQPGPRNGAGGPQNRRGAQGFPPPIASVLDHDGNGALSATEVAAAPTQLLKLDTDSNEELSAAEICPGGQGGGNQACPYGGNGQRRGLCGTGQTPVLLRLFDMNQDGVLSKGEIEDSAAILMVLDTDANNEISNPELRAAVGCTQNQQCQRGRMGQGRGQRGLGACGQGGMGPGRGNCWGRNAQAQ